MTRSAAPLPLLVGLAVLPAVLLAGVWQYADTNVVPPTTTTTTAAPPPLTDELATDLLSFRRQPEPLVEQAAAAQAAAALAEHRDTLEGLTGEGACVRVVDGESVLVDEAATVPVIPASNQKLLVASVALDVLGPDHRFRTELQSVRPVDGVIAGDVYLIGGGDPVLRTAAIPDPLRYPSFNTTSLDTLADQVVALGVTTIQGDVVGDGSRYDDEFRAPDWGDGISSAEAGPYDALLVNDALLSSGDYGLEPNRAAARAFLDLLIARGITVTGAAGNGQRPAEADFTTLAFVESLPLSDVLTEMLHTSDNNTAEMLVKEIGFSRTGEGTRPAGLDVIRTTVDAWGLPTGGMQLADGSGLSRNNRVTCELLTALVSSSPVADDLVELLPAAGRDGTLAAQFIGTPAEGTLKAKTGTLTDVKALTGREPGGDRRPIEFSIVLNQPDADEPAVYLPVWRAMVELVDSYPVTDRPDLADFEPR